MQKNLENFRNANPYSAVHPPSLQYPHPLSGHIHIPHPLQQVHPLQYPHPLHACKSQSGQKMVKMDKKDQKQAKMTKRAKNGQKWLKNNPRGPTAGKKMTLKWLNVGKNSIQKVKKWPKVAESAAKMAEKCQTTIQKKISTLPSSPCVNLHYQRCFTAEKLPKNLALPACLLSYSVTGKTKQRPTW